MCIPRPPFACTGTGTCWLPAVVEVERADGWVVATLAPQRSLRSWDRRVVVPPEGVRRCLTRAG